MRHVGPHGHTTVGVDSSINTDRSPVSTASTTLGTLAQLSLLNGAISRLTASVASVNAASDSQILLTVSSA